jgi:zinc protease
MMMRKVISLMTFLTCLTVSALSLTEGWAGARAQKKTLQNGLTLIVSERNELPTLHLQLLIRAGASADPENLRGLANMTAELLTQGTKKRDAARISREIESVGGSLTSSAEADFSVLALTILKKDLTLGMEVLSDVLLNPTFPSEEIERKRAEIRARLQRMDEDPRQVARRAFFKRLFGNHPYAFPEEGTMETVQAVTREDIVRFYRSFYRPNNAILVMVGQVGLEEAEKAVLTHFKDWEQTSIDRSPLPPLPPLKGVQIEKIDRPITQANIVLGHLGIARSHPDFYALQVMNYILGGGGFASRLVDRIRDDLGLTYGIYSHFDAREHPGAFLIAVETQNRNANTAVREILQEIRKIMDQGVTPAELAEAQAYLTGSFPLRMDSNGKMVRLLSTMEFYGLGLDYPERYPELIRKVTKEEVLRVARTYLHPENFLLVVVGDQKEVQLQDKWP